jgi:hypothetical protein
MADTHTVMTKKLAQALMEAGMHHFDSGGLIGGLSNALGTSNNFTANTAGDTNVQDVTQYGQEQGVYAQQQDLAKQLLAQSQGQGPAQQLIAQQGANNQAQQAATMASVRGASANPAAIARQAAIQGMQGQQQVLNAQAGAQLQSQNALAGQYGTMANEGLQGQSIAQGAIAAANNVNAGVAGQNAQGNRGLLGGIVGGVAGALGLAHGGTVPKMASGGMMGIQQYGGGAGIPDYSGLQPGQQDPFSSALASGMKAGKGARNLWSQDGSATPSMPTLQDPALGSSAVPSVPDPTLGASTSLTADPSLASDPTLNPMNPTSQAIPTLQMPSGYACGGKIPFNQMLAGGRVGGKAKVAGDSEENDTEPTLLSPGEAVIPRSIMQSPNAAKKAAEFIAHLKAKKSGGYNKVAEARKKKA